MGRNARQLTRRFPRQVHVVEADALRTETLDGIFRGIAVAYYLIHSLAAGERGFRKADQTAARNFAMEAKAAGVGRIIYLGGLGNRNSQLSAHLLSPSGNERSPARVWPSTDRIPLGGGSGGNRCGQRIVRDAPLSDGTRANHDLSALGHDAHPADRH